MNNRISTMTFLFPQENMSTCDEAVHAYWQTTHALRAPVHYCALQFESETVNSLFTYFILEALC
jgi:hypothetical protein